MATVTFTLGTQKAQEAFNLRRWDELLADTELAKIEGRFETDRHGRGLFSPPPVPRHGSFQSEIAFLLRTLMPLGRVLTECPISTADGVKAADIAWASVACMRELGNRSCFPRSPEICVEVLSPGNTEAELQEKVALYLDAGAQEVWIWASTGIMKFLGSSGGRPLKSSRLCPSFPKQVVLR